MADWCGPNLENMCCMSWICAACHEYVLHVMMCGYWHTQLRRLDWVSHWGETGLRWMNIGCWMDILNLSDMDLMNVRWVQSSLTTRGHLKNNTDSFCGHSRDTSTKHRKDLNRQEWTYCTQFKSHMFNPETTQNSYSLLTWFRDKLRCSNGMEFNGIQTMRCTIISREGAWIW